METGAKVVPHAKCVAVQMTIVAVQGGLFALILERIQPSGVHPPLVERG